MTWEEQLKLEKGIKDKVKALIKRMKDASFKKKMKKFLKDNLIVDYDSEGYKHPEGYIYNRTTDREQSLTEAKQLLLKIVEESWDETFPKRKTYQPYDDSGGEF
jgi:cell division protein YceG involved in septum cleavage